MTLPQPAQVNGSPRFIVNWIVAALASLVVLFGSFWVAEISRRMDTLQRAVESISAAQQDINRDREKRLASLEATLIPMRAQLDRIESKIDDRGEQRR